MKKNSSPESTLSSEPTASIMTEQDLSHAEWGIVEHIEPTMIPDNRVKDG
jgi:hypothetical protein